jgi:uncharacterized protein YoxC
VNEFKIWHLIIILALVFVGGFLLRGAFKSSREVREIQATIGDIQHTVDRIESSQKEIIGAKADTEKLDEFFGAVERVSKQLGDYYRIQGAIYQQLTEQTASNIESIEHIEEGATSGAGIVEELIEADTP